MPGSDAGHTDAPQGRQLAQPMGVVAHAVTTNIRKRPLIVESVKESTPAGQVENEEAK